MTGIQQDCVGTTEEWEDENPLLAEGVRGLEITEDGRRYYKVGDGVKLWNDLPYLDKTMIRGLAEELDRIDLNRVPDNDVPEMDGEGSAGDPENWNYSRGDHRHPSDTSRVALESAVTQIIDSDIALSNGKKLLGVKKNAAQANLVSVGDYGTYEQIEVGTESDPLCLNHSAKAPDGTVTGKNILVNYKDTAGVNKADTVAYGSDVEALKRDMDAWIGRGGFLDEHDFETGTPTQEALTAYALSQIPTITDPLEIWNGTKIPNAYDNHVWILTNTQDTDPAVFEWTDQGVTTMVPFNEDIGGYIIGADTDDPDGTIESTGGGKGRPKGWDSLGRSLFDMEHPVGSTFTQEPWDLAPADRNWPGNWVNWSFRAWEYCLSQTAPSSAFIADWKQKRHDIWNLNTDGTVATQGTKKYAVPSDYVRIPRQVIHNNVWDDDDLAEGGQVQGGPYDGWYVWQVLAPAGIFPAVEDDDWLPADNPAHYTGGGLRPPFVSGGVMGDMMRNIEGNITGIAYPAEASVGASGVFTSSYQSHAGAAFGGTLSFSVNFNSSRAVVVGPQNSPVTASVRVWRRLPDIPG